MKPQFTVLQMRQLPDCSACAATPKSFDVVAATATLVDAPLRRMIANNESLSKGPNHQCVMRTPLDRSYSSDEYK